MSSERPRILCVDDEKNVLEGLTRTLRTRFEVETGVGGMEGLSKVRTRPPFAIIMSDLRMPEMTGVQFLAQARAIAPDSVRVLLTGQGDMEAAISAVNDGNIFRFLTKPCPTEVLSRALAASLDQHRLITSEKILLEQTLRGSIETLTEILSLSNPAAFGRATRVKDIVVELMDPFFVKERWPIEVAAMLSQIGYVTLPSRTQEKVYEAQALTAEETAMVERIPVVIEQLLGRIPRLESVREILKRSAKPYRSDGGPREHSERDTIVWGARALRLAIDFDTIESESDERAIETLRGREGYYDPALLDALLKLRGKDVPVAPMLELRLREVRVGMIFADDIRSSKDILLIARGQVVTPSLQERVRNFSSDLGVKEPVRMYMRQMKTQAEVTPEAETVTQPQ